MESSDTLFEAAVAQLKETYASYRFFTERDIVWTIQLDILRRIAEQQLPYILHYNYPLYKGVLADLVIFNERNVPEVAVEFKYEPSHRRADILPAKFPVIFWTGMGSVAKDVERTRQYVIEGRVQAAYALFIDEGGFFRHRPPHLDSVWLDWEMGGIPTNRVSVLWTRMAADRAHK